MSRVKTREKKYKNIRNKKAIIGLIILVALLCLLLLVRQTFARYQTITSAATEIEYAFYVLDTDYQTTEINIGNIVPREDNYEYIFSVSNFNTIRRTETNLTYDLWIRTTTNLPLNYDLYELESLEDTNTTSIIESDSIIQDEHGTYFRKITAPSKEFSYREDQTYFYKLVINFPLAYKDSQYQDIIESIEINIDSKQKLSI